MKNLTVHVCPEDAVADLVGQLGLLGGTAHWQNLVVALTAGLAPCTYDATESFETQNLSNWFGLVCSRHDRYDATPTGDVLRSLYVAHELAHLVPPVPWTLTYETAPHAFATSEAFASYETELRVHLDAPCLSELVPFRPLLATFLRDAGVDLTDAAALIAWRARVAKNPDLLAELPSEAARLASYSDNDTFARRWWVATDRLGMWDAGFSHGMGRWWPGDYRARIAHAAARGVDADEWEARTTETVRRAFVLCGEPAPVLACLADARAAAADLDGATILIPDLFPELRTPLETADVA